MLKKHLFQLLLDSGSRGYWLNEMAMVIHTDVEASLKLQCADLLLTALDNCRDVIQVTDSQVSHFFSLSNSKGASINYVDKILRIFDPLPPFVDKFTT